MKNLSARHDGIVTPRPLDAPDSSDPFDVPGFRHLTTVVPNGEIELHVEALLPDASVANVTEAPIVLLSEAEAPSSRWPKMLLRGLAQLAGGVIWFDTRDCGRSSHVEFEYAMEDLMVDVLLVLDAFDCASAHVLGRSMGGQIAQQLGLAMPDRVESLTLLSTTPGRREDLGMPAEWLIDKMTERLFADPPLDVSGRADWLVDQQQWFSGPVFGFDRPSALVAANDEASACWRGPNGHGAAVVEAPDIFDYLEHIEAPALIIHGTADPVYPVPHAQALAERLPNAQLELIEGLGHELPDAFVSHLLELMRKAIFAPTD